MSYLVLARKYRPQTFEEVVGQDHITHLLAESIRKERLGQAFLFSGPRGIGKTTCARILAKGVNCEKGLTSTPCGKCASCQSIAQGNSFDVLEIDGASNRGIDEIRSIRENVKFVPSVGRYKIYIVDEVHMLTTEAFNALLKTLEEPPEHVKFIFATTDPNKLPATILSRCQRFDFRRVAVPLLKKTLGEIAKKESLSLSDEASFAIAKAARGSVRDALSIFDQLSALSDNEIGTADVTSMLGLVETEHVFRIVDYLAAKDCCGAIEVFDEILAQGKDLKQFVKDMAEHFRHLMLLKIAGTSHEKLVAMGRMVEYPKVMKDALLEQTRYFTLSDILLSIEVFVGAQEMARVTEFERLPVEIAFARLTLAYQGTGVLPKMEKNVKKKTAKSNDDDYKPGQMIKNTKGEIPDLSSKEQDASDEEPASDISEDDFLSDEGIPAHQQCVLELSAVKEKWPEITHAVSQKRMSLATYLQDASPIAVKNKTIVIGFAPDNAFFKESLEHGDNIVLVESAISEFLGMGVFVKYQLVKDFQPEAQEDNSEQVKAALKAFGGEIVSRWHQE